MTGWLSTGSILILLALPWASACSSGDERVFQGGNNEAKPQSTALVEKLNADLESAEVMGTYTYAIKIATKSGVSFDGKAKLQVLSDFSLRTLEADIQIGSLKLNLKSLTSRLSFDFFKEAQDKIVLDGGIVYLRKFGSATFDPPRPLFIGPIVRNVERFKNLKKTSTHTVKVDDGNKPMEGQGTFTVEVLETKGTYKPPRPIKGIDFSNILHWQLTSSGFETVPTDQVLSFRKIEWWYNTSPIGVAKISITGDLGDMLKQGEKNQKAIVGEVTISMEIVDQKI
jgi:hypothetical protein